MKLSEEQIKSLVEASENHRCDPFDCCVRLEAIADLPSNFGDFQICALVSPCDGKEHTAIIKGNIIGKGGVVCRIHSECLTGDVMGSQRCDCRAQLLESLKYIEANGEGVLLYLRQEGRNIGLTEKLKAYALQDKGYDTIEANLLLGWQPDSRDYGVAAHILKTLGIKSIKILTNNPEKIEQLKAHGIKILERIPLVIEPTEYSEYYLETKQKKAGHLLGDFATIREIEKIEEIAAEFDE
ncbi:MAG: GTP cyclohydrolase II [Candidatus Lokiarchaeota archaeon]|nr:GTP cyclohydrolase II [Candidatus Lokiarchaeota archaeon]